ncbi:hypothetical protein [Dyadobacter frigoris]|uniref:Uncharacterized protein n=1 Tax=Dyadobacter frigoris TaxID=2576211 RepID=A0A4U6D1N6_9BACT|nr:hypothetical protein [Dyadobacter frigoris]TKT90516.1 hypothetical protein FDK13_19475 [Dyadobacter frigoris]GLU51351.1 hypothetical protein Dfri01_08120 [Dyadobacter frigoris]
MNEATHIEPVNAVGTFTAEFGTDKSRDSKRHTRMHIVIMNGFVKGYYSEAGLTERIDVVGALSSRSEMILIESQRGEITRTFQGKFKKKGKELILLSGIWQSANNTMLTRLTENKVMPDSDHPQAFSLISKKQ